MVQASLQRSVSSAHWLKTSGTVEIFGYNLDIHPSEAKQCLGVVPQEFNFGHFEKPLIFWSLKLAITVFLKAGRTTGRTISGKAWPLGQASCSGPYAFWWYETPSHDCTSHDA